MSRSNEAFFWSLFAPGGVMAALFLPAIMLATGFVLPTGDAAAAAHRYEKLHMLVGHPLTKIILVVVIFLSFFHCAHRIGHTSRDVGLRAVGGLISAVCYLGALAGTIATIVILWRI